MFLDQEGHRWPLLRKMGAALIVLILAGVAIFLGSLFINPPLPSALTRMKKEIRTIQERQRVVSVRDKTPWARYEALKKSRLVKRGGSERSLKPSPATHRTDEKIRLGYFRASDIESVASLTRHARQLTHVATESLFLSGVGEPLTVKRDESTLDFLRKNRLAHIAILSNYDDPGDTWVPEAVEDLAFGSEERRKDFIAGLLKALDDLEARGVLLDWQGIDPAYQTQVARFLSEMGEALRSVHRELWLKVSVGEDLNAFDLPTLAASVDHFVAALHDENGQADPPGPIASADWFNGWLQALLRETDPSQWIIGLGAYGYDWSGRPGGAEEISFSDAMTRARFSGADDVEVAPPDFNPMFAYSENGREHTVWFLDAVTFANQLRAVRAAGIDGVAIDRLGAEDAGIWQVLEAFAKGPMEGGLAAELAILPGEERITHVGEGEIVSVETLEQTDGARRVARSTEGAFTETYTAFPVFPTLFHTGGGEVSRAALTFDDGPDPEWTPRILDILKKYHARATFFVLGANAEKYPALLRRIVAEGHEIGSHTFTHTNLAAMPEQQVTLELNATQRVIENATGLSTLLFRPPFDADSQPEDVAQLRPLQIAQDLGYLTVLERVDPQDWDRPGTQEIVRRIQEQKSEGTIVLLHDAGGPRHQTLEALPFILENFRKEGIRVVSVSELLGMSREEVMPRVDPHKRNSWASSVSGTGFMILRFLSEGVWFLIMAATVLVAVRTVIIAGLACLHWRKEPVITDFAPPLSVVIPAFREERVIAATLHSLLQSDYPGGIEILVVDDGSPDNTSGEAARVADLDARVRVIRQPNQGKAAALENGVNHARHDILVFLDADTHFLPDTFRQLVAPLADAKVGAVAGHPRVGNPRTLIARCQDIEYLMAFNLDRRALSLWNAVTVIPGAVSAFRRQTIVEAGGFRRDTLAEDADLTLSIHEAGWRMECAPRAVALTEAPETARALVKQRFRWALGTMQSVWKHRHQTFSRRHPALGWFSLPGVWLFQILLVASAPLIDLLFLQSAVMGRWGVVLPYFFVFLASDLLLAWLACRMEPIRWTHALWVLPMRFLYRPLLSFVVWRAIAAALRGAWVGWGKLDRTGTVTTPATPRTNPAA